ncbi:hypothetical protein P775_06850 [Puniceibacterium antarcticum]|uniref:Porin domain-containing protein n=1 Tax=Puniceibacterium antarcticum TaxID=1206336 RepID=A0A2G8RHF2_9RHOB|nr:hypothetical protein [Puniceibacterium antarcticum]PIL20979.1 hypothetical protein P775_06850 [Puniceibacterium antarcticum]
MQSPIKMFALPLALIAAGGLNLSVSAQSYDTGEVFDTGGIELTTGVELSVSSEDNRALETTSAGNSTEAQARLSFGLLRETQVSRLALDLSGTLRAIDTPDDTSQNNGFDTPGVSLSYGRSSASARLGLSASLRESELSQDYLDADGLDYVTGTATRRLTNAEASLNWGEDSSLGFGTFARIATTTYRDGTASGLDGAALDDSTRRTLGATSRMDLDAARRLDLGLTWSDFEQDTIPDRRETLSLNSTLTQELVRGALTLGLNATSTEEGERYGATLGRSLEMPSGQVSGQIGLNSSVSGNTYLSGGLDLSRDLARGKLTFGLSRAVSSSDTDDTEVLRTQASMGLTQELTPISGIRFGLNLSKSEETDNGAQSSNANFGVTYNRELPSDWTFATGYNHRIREDDAGDTARSNRVFLQMQRSFVTRF